MRSHSWLQAALPLSLALAALVVSGAHPTVSAQAGNSQQRTLFVTPIEQFEN